MAENERPQRVTVAVETIRAEFGKAMAELELRLVQHFASKSEFDDLRSDVDDLKVWSSRLKGSLAVVVTLVLILLPITIKLLLDSK